MRVQGSEFDEILYVDDTILISEKSATAQKYLHKIEEESAKYGMKLNKTKCEVISINGKDAIKFQDGTSVPPHDTVKYLGCVINDKGDPKKEISKRISERMVIWKRLGPLWKHTSNPTRCKLLVYDAIVRSKLMYGLESAQLNDSIKKRLDAFQLKGLRKILQIQTTYMDRSNTNEYVHRRAEEEANPGINATSPNYKRISKLSDYYERCRRLTTLELIQIRDTNDPRVKMTMQNESLKMQEYRKNRWVVLKTLGGSSRSRSYGHGLAHTEIRISETHCSTSTAKTIWTRFTQRLPPLLQPWPRPRGAKRRRSF